MATIIEKVISWYTKWWIKHVTIKLLCVQLSHPMLKQVLWLSQTEYFSSPQLPSLPPVFFPPPISHTLARVHFLTHSFDNVTVLLKTLQWLHVALNIRDSPFLCSLIWDHSPNPNSALATWSSSQMLEGPAISNLWSSLCIILLLHTFSPSPHTDQPLYFSYMASQIRIPI